jgi:hypothetical protein
MMKADGQSAEQLRMFESKLAANDFIRVLVLR